MGSKITNIRAMEILDSRGNPTVEATVTLESGAVGVASVPSGASVGKYEAHEKRDGDPKRYGGRGVLGAVSAVNGEIHDTLCGRAMTQEQVDEALLALDGTSNKGRLGANAILAVSLAFARASAEDEGTPLYEHLEMSSKKSLPCPMLNIMNGGAHAKNNIEIQEFMIVPIGIEGFTEKLAASVQIYKALGKILNSKGYTTTVGDEGGYAPNLGSDEEALELICSAISEVGYEGKVKLALDVASSDWYSDGVYTMAKSGRKYSAEELVSYYERLSSKYPIISIEDGVGEEDYSGWRLLTDRLGAKIMLVGDDLFVTNEQRVAMGMEMNIANAVLIKPNQIGSLTETLRVIRLCKSKGYKTIISHRSGDTEDSFIADLAVAAGAPFIKTGAPARSERTSKYNRLLRIEGEIL